MVVPARAARRLHWYIIFLHSKNQKICPTRKPECWRKQQRHFTLKMIRPAWNSTHTKTYYHEKNTPYKK